VLFRKYLLIMLVGVFALAGTAEAAQRTAKAVKRDKQRTQQEIAETKKKIKDNERQTLKKLDEPNHIGSQIERQHTAIMQLSTRLDSLEGAINVCNDSINKL
jgi:septal ring factor EnvC (AmiA/AmiB activator)